MGKYKRWGQSSDKGTLKKAGKKIYWAQEKTKDDMMMNECAKGAIQRILNNFKNRRSTIYNEFRQVRDECNRVLEVQKRAYADIMAVKKDYQKNYKKIMGEYFKTLEDIRKGTNFKNIKPNMKDYMK